MSGSAELDQLDVLDGLLTRTREALGSVLGPESRLLPLDVAAQRLVDRASTSYRKGYEAGRRVLGDARLEWRRCSKCEQDWCAPSARSDVVCPWCRAEDARREGYEAGRAATPHPGFRECVRCAFAWDERQGINCPNCEVIALQTQLQARPVLASNPPDPKCASIFEAAEMIASVTSCMSKLAQALEETSEKAEAAEKIAREADAARRIVESANKRLRKQAWDDSGEIDKLRDQLRLITKERDDERAQANEWLVQLRDLKRQLGETQEALGKATERAERAEKMLTTERRS